MYPKGSRVSVAGLRRRGMEGVRLYVPDSVDGANDPLGQGADRTRAWFALDRARRPHEEAASHAEDCRASATGGLAGPRH